MYALRKARQQWEFENRRQIERIAKAIHSTAIITIVRAARTLSLLFYIVYKCGGWILNVLRLLFIEPRLIQRVGQGQRPLERYEFEKAHQPVDRRVGWF